MDKVTHIVLYIIVYEIGRTNAVQKATKGNNRAQALWRTRLFPFLMSSIAIWLIYKRLSEEDGGDQIVYMSSENSRLHKVLLEDIGPFQFFFKLREYIMYGGKCIIVFIIVIKYSLKI